MFSCIIVLRSCRSQNLLACHRACCMRGSVRGRSPNYHQRKSNAIFLHYFRETPCYLEELNLVNHISFLVKKDVKPDQSLHMFAIQIIAHLTEYKFLKNEKELWHSFDYSLFITRNKPLMQSEYTLHADCSMLMQLGLIL